MKRWSSPWHRPYPPMSELTRDVFAEETVS